jgi:hypothetical protein
MYPALLVAAPAEDVRLFVRGEIVVETGLPKRLGDQCMMPHTVQWRWGILGKKILDITLYYVTEIYHHDS